MSRRKGKIDELDAGHYRIDGWALLSDVSEALSVPLPSTTAHTIGGLIMRQLRHLAKSG